MDRSRPGVIDHDPPDPVIGVVRSFSDDLSAQQSDDALTNALAAKVADDRATEQQALRLQHEWRRLFQDAGSLAPDGSYEQKLLQQTQKLTVAWERFVRKLPKAQQSNLRDKPPSLATLFHAVDDAQQSWESKRKETKRGRFKGLFGNTCQSFDDYKTLFELIPADDKYIRLLTGTLSTIVTATVNHEDIAEGISDGLENLCDDVFFWRRQLLLFQDEPLMQRYSLDLYLVVFEFLVDIFTNWSQSSWDRFRHSFDRKFFEKLVASRKAKMAEIANRLNREASLATQRHQKSTATRQDQEAMMLQLWQKFDARFKDLEQKVVLGGQVQLMVTDSGRDALAEMRRVTFAGNNERPSEPRKTGSIPATSSPEPARPLALADEHASGLRPEDLMKLVVPISKYVQKGYVEELLANASDTAIEPNVYKSLRSWTTQATLPLWIEGPYDAETPSIDTLTVASLIYTIRQSKLPVLFHFCDKASTIPKSREDFFGRELTELVYALIAQLTPQVEAELEAPPLVTWEIRAEQFAALDGSSESLDSAITLLERLLHYRPHPIFVIIDGLNIVEDLRDREHSRRLARLLDVLCDPSRKRSLYKICFTTAGNVDALGNLAAQDRVQSLSSGERLESEDEEVEDDFRGLTFDSEA